MSRSNSAGALADRRRHRSISGEVEELTARLDATLTRSSQDESAVELRLNSQASPRRQQSNRTLSDSAAILDSSRCSSGLENKNGRSGPDLTTGLPLPPIPPRRARAVEKRSKEDNNSPPRLLSNGLPPTPKVHMGACFMKVTLPALCSYRDG